MSDVVQVVTKVADTVVDVVFVDGTHDLGWVDARIDGFVAHVGGATHAITAAPRRIQCGIAELTLVRVARPMRSVARPATDRRLIGYLVASLAMHLCMWNLASAYGPSGGHPGATIATSPRVALRYTPPVGASEHDGTGEGVRMQLGEGGRARAPAAGTRSARMAPTRNARAHALEQARTAGFMGALPGDAVGEVVGTAGISLAVMASEGAGPDGTGSGEGGFGGGRTALGEGGGTGWGTIASGRYGTLGTAPDEGSAWSPGRGYGGLRARGSAVPQIYLCGSPNPKVQHSCVKVVGEIDKHSIRRYLRRNLTKFQYCYEKELLHDEQLAGTVETEFMIGPTGAVVSARASGMSPAVSTCIADVLRAIAFPRATGGGSTLVHYPFTFRTAG